MKQYIQSSCISIALVIIFIAADEGFPQVKYQRAGSSTRNRYGGYDFYSPSGKKTGFSKPNRKGGYNFYDSKGNQAGSLKPRGKNKRVYTYYDVDGVKRGVMRKRASGAYYYKDVESGKRVDSIPQSNEGLGSLSPDVFRGEKR